MNASKSQRLVTRKQTVLFVLCLDRKICERKVVFCTFGRSVFPHLVCSATFTMELTRIFWCCLLLGIASVIAKPQKENDDQNQEEEAQVPVEDEEESWHRVNFAQ